MNIMESKKLKFEDFKAEQITKNQQKMVRGGDDPVCEVDLQDGRSRSSTCLRLRSCCRRGAEPA